MLNAWQEGTKIHFVMPEAKNNMFPFFPDVHGAPFNPEEAMSKLTRWTVDMASNSDEFDFDHAADRHGERISRGSTTASPASRTAMAGGWRWTCKRPVELKGGSAGGLLMNCLFLKDLETGAEQHWWCGPVQQPAGAMLHSALATMRRKAMAGSCRFATGWRSIAATC